MRYYYSPLRKINHLLPSTNAGFRLACRSPLCCYAAWSSLAVSELQFSSVTLLWLYHREASLPSWIEFNCLRSAAVGKAARLLIYWHDASCRLVIPLQQVALAQLYKNHHQSGNVMSGKLVWKQHKLTEKISRSFHNALRQIIAPLRIKSHSYFFAQKITIIKLRKDWQTWIMSPHLSQVSSIDMALTLDD